MFDRKRLDEYIQETVPGVYDPNMLFFLFDTNKGELQYVFENPVEIIRESWKRHTLYSHIDGTYRDTLAFLYHKSNELMYHTASRKFETMLEKPENCTKKDINDASVLFLSQHSSLCPNLLFGYVKLPEQHKMLHDVFKSLELYEPEKIIEAILATADDTSVNKFNAKEKTKIV